MFVAAHTFTTLGQSYRPGDACPEAATWPNLKHLLRLGWIVQVPTWLYSGAST